MSLPRKENTPPPPDNFELCHRRLDSLLRRLKQNPPLLAEYDSVIRDQLSRGIIKVVNNTSLDGHERIYYLPHHGVVRQPRAGLVGPRPYQTTARPYLAFKASCNTRDKRAAPMPNKPCFLPRSIRIDKTVQILKLARKI